jgi:flagellin
VKNTFVGLAGEASKIGVAFVRRGDEVAVYLCDGQTISVNARTLVGTDVDSAIFNFSGSSVTIASIDQAIENVSTARAEFGAVQNRLEHTLNSLAQYEENLTASESRIRDVDMAKEMVEYTKFSILAQAGQQMLSQANQAPQSVLQLLQ